MGGKKAGKRVDEKRSRGEVWVGVHGVGVHGVAWRGRTQVYSGAVRVRFCAAPFLFYVFQREHSQTAEICKN